ncbi:prepilin-type N-terminal cleavage/methylation domain-containing protein [Halobacillus locisalis]|uniref:Prepilin-type N-terminal cleavage/methylation domain-containing protein n=1 Tax=Halobacillus locisalis TaxID=220753 RepID=A0A838CP46_9BACI|nr:prepilin-type N-terminal cleavage/methylation domain-containing protein [Halobacillus locisalis]
MNNSRGFTLVETLTAFSLFLFLTLTLLPLLFEVRSSQKDLSIQRLSLSTLHDQLHTIEEKKEATLPLIIQDHRWSHIYYEFTIEDQHLKGCLKIKEETIETICLFARSP